MIDNIIEPALKKRSWEVVKICEESNKELFGEFEMILKKLKRYAPIELMEDLHTIEDLFLRRHTEMVLEAHRLGFEDCRSLNRELREFLL